MHQNNADKIMHQLHHCMNLMHRSPCAGGHQNGKGMGQHRGQGRIMALLSEQDGLSQRELAELLHIRPSSLSELLDKLESAGMIQRMQNLADKRISHIFLTDLGKSTAATLKDSRQEKHDQLMSALSDDEQSMLSQLLDKLLSNLTLQTPSMHMQGQCACGPRGNQGHRGKQGPCSHQGHRGNQGPCGNQGHRGNQGSCGHHGHQGPCSNQGYRGNHEQHSPCCGRKKFQK